MSDIFTTVITAVAGGAVPVIGYWVNARITNHTAKASFEATNAILKKEIAQLEAKDSASQAKILELQAYIEKHLTIRAIRDRFTVDPATADLMIGNGHYCSRCFHDGSDPPTEIQMQSIPNGQFICSTCNMPRKIAGPSTQPPRYGTI